MTLLSDGLAVFPAAGFIAPELLDLAATVPIPLTQKLRVDKNFVRCGFDPHPAHAIGKDRALLDLIAEYLGHRPLLVDKRVAHSFPTNGPAKSSQLWHRDPGETKVVKVFMYLSDVTEDNGPFTYIPGTHLSGALGKIEPKRVEDIPERDIRITDNEMRAYIPEDKWLSVTGPRHTVIVADTKGYHKGPKVMSGSRLVLAYLYR